MWESLTVSDELLFCTHSKIALLTLNMFRTVLCNIILYSRSMINSGQTQLLGHGDLPLGLLLITFQYSKL